MSIRNSSSKSALGEADYLQGYTYQQVADKYGVKVNTVKTWAVRDCWSAKKAQLEEQLQETLFRRISQRVEISVDRYLAFSQAVGKLLVEAITEIMREGKSLRDPATRKEVESLVFIAQKASGCHKNVVPNFSEEVAQRILEQLEDLSKKKGKLSGPIGAVVDGHSKPAKEEA